MKSDRGVCRRWQRAAAGAAGQGPQGRAVQQVDTLAVGISTLSLLSLGSTVDFLPSLVGSSLWLRVLGPWGPRFPVTSPSSVILHPF